MHFVAVQPCLRHMDWVISLSTRRFGSLILPRWNFILFIYIFKINFLDSQSLLNVRKVSGSELRNV